MGDADRYAGFVQDQRGLEVTVLRWPWRHRFIGPVLEALAEVGWFASEVNHNYRRRGPHRRTTSAEVRHDSVVASVLIIAFMAALCLLSAVVELVLLLLVWPFWLVALRFPGVPRTVEVRRGTEVVTSTRARNRAQADELTATYRRRITEGGPLEPEPTDFSDLLVRPWRGRRRGASRHTAGRPAR